VRITQAVDLNELIKIPGGGDRAVFEAHSFHGLLRVWSGLGEGAQLDLPGVLTRRRITDGDVAACHDKSASDVVLTQNAQAFIRRVTFGDATEVEEHAGLGERDGFRLGIELNGLPVRGGERLLQAVRRRKFLETFGTPPKLREIAGGDVKSARREL
jgi:hypothetical protein